MGFDASEYGIRHMQAGDFGAIREICRRVYPHDAPYTESELAEHNAVYPQGQFVAEHLPTSSVAGVHFTLRLMLADFHIDDPWDVLTAHGSFADHNPRGHTLYGADVFVSPDHQHHGLAHALTDATRGLVVEENLWRMVGGSRLPGYAQRRRNCVARCVRRRGHRRNADRSRPFGASEGRLDGRESDSRLYAGRSRKRQLRRRDPVGEPRLPAAARVCLAVRVRIRWW